MWGGGGGGWRPMALTACNSNSMWKLLLPVEVLLPAGGAALTWGPPGRFLSALCADWSVICRLPHLEMILCGGKGVSDTTSSKAVIAPVLPPGGRDQNGTYSSWWLGLELHLPGPELHFSPVLSPGGRVQNCNFSPMLPPDGRDQNCTSHPWWP
ncbi:unnamed protein product [Gadus morhua 'NCC']